MGYPTTYQGIKHIISKEQKVATTSQKDFGIAPYILGLTASWLRPLGLNNPVQSWTKSGQTCNLDNVLTRLGFINLKRGSYSAVLDKLRTDLVPRQTLDKVWIS